MGVGNFFVRDGRSVYVDHEEVYGEFILEEDRFEQIECDEDYRFMYEDFCEEVKSLLNTSYTQLNGVSRRDVEGVAVGENGLFLVTIVDWESYFSVNVIPRPDLEDHVERLAHATIDRAALALFDRMAELWDLRVRCCAWTCGPYSKAA